MKIVLLTSRGMSSEDPQDTDLISLPFLGGLPSFFNRGSVVKDLPANAGDAGDSGLIPVLGSSPGEGNSNSLQYS